MAGAADRAAESGTDDEPEGNERQRLPYAHRHLMAGPSGALWPVCQVLQPLQSLEKRRDLVGKRFRLQEFMDPGADEGDDAANSQLTRMIDSLQGCAHRHAAGARTDGNEPAQLGGSWGFGGRRSVLWWTGTAAEDLRPVARSGCRLRRGRGAAGRYQGRKDGYLRQCARHQCHSRLCRQRWDRSCHALLGQPHGCGRWTEKHSPPTTWCSDSP